MNIRLVFIPLLAAAISTATAAPAPAAARAEIDALLSSLAASGCEFNRNGSWHTGAQAREHLLRKLDYLEGKDAVKRAEDFIEQQLQRQGLPGAVRRPGHGGQQGLDARAAEGRARRAGRRQIALANRPPPAVCPSPRPRAPRRRGPREREANLAGRPRIR